MIKSAFYEKEITPPLGCPIPGYFNLRLGSNVKDRLYAKAAVVDNGNETVAIIGLDACLVKSDVREAVVARVEKYTGIKPENVVFSNTHTHTGIPQHTRMLKEEETDLIAMNSQNGYKAVLCRLIADCVTLAYYRLEESELTFGIGEVHGISFCRDYFMKSSTPKTNPGRLNSDIDKPVAGIDPQLPLLFFKDKCGNPKGAVISFGCHLDCVDGTEYSGDFASVLAKELKCLYGQDFVTVFLMGPSGNINHVDVAREKDAPDHYVMMGKIIAGEAIKTIAKAKPIVGENIVAKFEVLKIDRTYIDPERISEAEHIVATIKPIDGIKLAADGTDPDQYNLAMSKLLLETVNGPKKIDVPLQVIKIGDFILYAFPSEPYYQFGLMIKERSSTKKHMVASMCNASYGYVLTRDMFYDTIYESRVGANILNHEAGYILTEKLIEMGK